MIGRMAVNLNFDPSFSVVGKVGDRVLMAYIRQDGRFELYTTNSENRDLAAVNNAAITKEIKMPVENEGVWGYFYYSYSVKEKKVTAFLKHATEDEY